MKKVNIKIIETIDEKQKKCLMKVFPDSRVSELKTAYCNLRDKENIQEYVFALDGKALADEKTLADNGINKPGQTYQVEIMFKKNVTAKIEIQEAPKAEVFKIKIKLQEKVGDQVLGADVEATNVMLLEKITLGYCKHRKYNPLDYVFAYGGVILDPAKAVGPQGIGKTKEDAGKTFVVQIYHKDKVQIKK